VEKYGLAPKISLLLCDGIDDGKMGDCSVFIVAGMGGELIGEILRKSAIAKKEGVTLILQPMTGEEELRLFLAEAVCRDRERLTKEGKAVPTLWPPSGRKKTRTTSFLSREETLRRKTYSAV
jgi:tRNA (adenine22-N1)-methyltransferase